MRSHSGLTAGFPVNFLYSLAQIRKTEYRFPLTVGGKIKTVKSEHATKFLVGAFLVGWSAVWVYFYCFFVFPPSHNLIYPQVPRVTSIQLSPFVLCCPHANPTEEQKTCDEAQNILTLFSSEETCGHKDQL